MAGLPPILEHEPLARYVAWRIGGPARLFATATTARELHDLVLWGWEQHNEVFILGGGSNILVSDAGFPGLVIRNRAQTHTMETQGGDVRLRIEAGAPMAGTSRRFSAQGYAGLVWSEGLPGTVGGAIYGNAGCYGGDMAGLLRSATLLLPDGKTEQWDVDRLQYGYRTSTLKRAATAGVRQAVVLEAELALYHDDPAKLAAEIAATAAARKAKTPSGSSCGSSFKNPPGDSAGRLLEAAGLKGTRVGGAEVSAKHANYIVNLGGATADDVLRLTDVMRERVLARFGVELELEVAFVGGAANRKHERRAVTQKRRIGVIFGGRNSEHEVSLKSARAVMAALDQNKYEIVPIGIDRQGRWVMGGDPLLALEQAANPQLLAHAPEPGVVAETTALRTTTGRLPDAGPTQVDVILPVLHGMYGEDGALQGLLELADVPYVGCNVLAAAVGMDKGIAKAAFAAAGLPQLPYLLVRRSDWARDRAAVVAQVEATLGYPVFSKPANAGSSVGVARCRNQAELLAGLDLAAQHDRRLIIEQGITPREIEVAVLGNDEPQASVPGEVVPGNEWYDYADKYLDGKTGYVIPAPLDPALTDEIQALALAAFKAIDGAGLARVDFLLDKTTGKVYLNEVNTFPGFTSGSMYPKLWEKSGLPYGALLDRLIELAIERHNDRRVRESGNES